MKRIALVLSLVVSFCGMASAATINQTTFNNIFQIKAFDPIGQSFTAEDALVEIAFWVAPINPNFPVDSITAELFEGEGFGGLSLGSATVTPAGGTSAFVQFFDNVTLAVGLSYSVRLTSPGAYWGIRLAVDTDPYAGGRAYHDSIVNYQDNGTSDLAFRVSPAAVPLPAGLPLIASALGGLWLLRRRSGHSART